MIIIENTMCTACGGDEYCFMKALFKYIYTLHCDLVLPESQYEMDMYVYI